MIHRSWKRQGFRLRNILYRLRFNIVSLVILLLLAMVGMTMLQHAMLRNAHDTGTSLSQNYAAEESGNLEVYQTLLTFGTSSIDRLIAEGEGREQLLQWMERYFQQLNSVIGEGSVDPYMVVDGAILAANPWEGDEGYKFAETEWYQRAMAADGEVIFTDVYTDVIYDRPIVTVAQKCRESDAILAFDILPESFSSCFGLLDLNWGESFFLCDSGGNLIYSQTDLTVPTEEIKAYLSDTIGKIEAGELEQFDSFITDLDGKKRAIYYTKMENGWFSIVTMPYSSILGGLRWFAVVFLAVILLFGAALIWMSWRELRSGAQIERTNETVRVLGNSYYALYRVDYEARSYEMIKGSDYVRDRIPQTGRYEELIRVAGEVIEEEAFHEFEESFSAENIQRLVKQRVRDYGGDFLRRFGDENRWVSIRVLFDESLAPGEVVLAFREVDQEKQQQMKERQILEDALALAQQNEAAKQAFFSNMSHDMRTPLNAIIGLSSLAEQHSKDPEKIGTYMKKIDLASRQLLSLINDLLDMSRMEQGKVILNNRSFNLRECLDETVDTFRMQAEEQRKHMNVEIEIEDELLFGDPFRITQILNNLLSNAMKFTQEDGTISVSAVQVGRGDFAKYRFVVSDTGVGMSADFLPHLFEPYSRELRFQARRAGGTGLGMSITKNLVSQMGGEIHVESEQGRGSTFTVILPFAAVREQEPAEGAETECVSGADRSGADNAGVDADRPGAGNAGADTDSVSEDSASGGSHKYDEKRHSGDNSAAGTSHDAARAAGGQISPQGGRGTGAEATGGGEKEGEPSPDVLDGKRILLAEDNEVNMEIFSELLKLHGALVVPAWNGREAVELFRDSEPFSFDVVLLDMQMPEMDGCEASRHIRAMRRPDAGRMPIIAVTANAFAEDIAATTAAGMDAHISKPIDFDLFCRTLERISASGRDSM